MSDLVYIRLKKSLLQRIHNAARELGMKGADYRAFLSGYGVESATDLSVNMLRDAISVLEQRRDSNKSDEELSLDRWRRRVYAAIAGWLGRTGRKEQTGNADYIRSIACKAAQTEKFAAIDLPKLVTIYNKFNKADRL